MVVVTELAQAGNRIGAALPAYRSRPRWRRAASAPGLRAAAAIVVVAGGIALGYGHRGPATADSVVALNTARGEIGIGDSFADLTEADLRELAAEMMMLQAVIPAEPEALDIPAVDREGEG